MADKQGQPVAAEHQSVRRILSEEVAEQKSRKELRSYTKKMLSSSNLIVPSTDKLKEVWIQNGQGHVFKFENQFTESEKQLFIKQLGFLNPAELNRIYQQALQTDKELTMQGKVQVKGIETTNKVDVSAEVRNRWTELGERAIVNGEVAALVLAGGQGSRLGSPLPKGMYDIELPSHKCLFQIHAERMVRLEKLLAQKYKKDKLTIPLYVMTSAATHKATKEFFKAKGFFGLDEGQVRFFRQGNLPAMDFDGKIIMESKHQIFLAPDGNGGLYKALRDKEILKEMEEKGIKWVSQYCVDNVLSKLVDPLFIGFTIEKKALVGCKAVRKTDPFEKVGVIGLKNGRPSVIEYSEIPKEMATARNNMGNLEFRASHVCINLFHIDFLNKAGLEYPTKFHIARKKIPTIDDKGQVINPPKENGMKFEQFIFDPWDYLDTLAVLEVPREEEFAALKNAPGSNSDSPETSREAVTNLHRKWIEAHGGIVLEASNKQDSLCEISPLISLEGEGLEFVKGKTFQMPFEIGIHPITRRPVVTSWSYL
jgi:UDP-N-acetylglucosamine/UDP-N-acetylgalactosamine diphosphorylase